MARTALMSRPWHEVALVTVSRSSDPRPARGNVREVRHGSKRSSALAGLGGLHLGLVLEDLLQDVVGALRQRVGPAGQSNPGGKEQSEHHGPCGHLPRPPGAPSGKDVRLTYETVD